MELRDPTTTLLEWLRLAVRDARELQAESTESRAQLEELVQEAERLQVQVERTLRSTRTTIRLNN